MPMSPMRLSLMPFIFMACAHAYTQTCSDQPQTLPSPDTSPDYMLCGNGVLNSGEVCDDGNKFGGDGCNAWCSGFDRLTSACTMAGGSTSCANGAPVLGLPSQSTFCSLTAIAGRDKSLFLADGGVIIQYDLLGPPTPLRAFASTPVRNSQYQRFCGIAPLPPPSTGVVAYECSSLQQLIIFPDPHSNDGVGAICYLNIQPGSTATPFYDAAVMAMLVAGAPVSQSSITSVAILVSVTLPGKTPYPITL
jgi:cysteine-rich repeat protein